MVLTFSFYGTAQNETSSFTIKGELLNDSTKETEPYATIKIAKKSLSSKALKIFVSDIDGNFKETISGTGDFILTVSSVGKQPLVKDFSVKSSDKIVDLGKLYLKTNANVLKEVEVLAQKPLVKAEIDKISYNIEEDPDSKTNSVIEMLRKVPLVTVDGNDNIQVKGSSNFKVYVDGKPNNMMSKNASEVLKSMPASSIKSIEVISNPGVKYDAEGVGGILNIITNKKMSMDGYTATLRGNASTRGLGGSIFAMVNKGKFTMSLNYSYNHNNQPRTDILSNRRTLGTTTINSYDLDNSGSSKNKANFQWGNLEASYEIDSLRLITASFGLWGGNNKSDDNLQVNAFTPGEPASALYNYNQLSNDKSSWFSIDGSIDYQRLFTVKDRLLTFSYKINTNPNKDNSYSTYEKGTDYVPYWETFLNSLNDQHNKSSQGTTENTFQADFSTPFHKLHTLEVGAKYILRNNSSDNDKYINENNSGYIFDTENSIHYRHVNNILAAYAGYTLKYKKFSTKAGVRYEYTYQDVKYKLGRGDNFSTHYNDFIPALSVSWSMTETSNISLGYNMRIQRPGIWYLNPYIDNSNPNTISQGNSNLKSEKNHSISLNYGKFSQKFNINFSASYSFTDNGIISITKLVNDNTIAGLPSPTGKDVLYTTYFNSGNSKNVNLNAYINWNPTVNTRVYANLTTAYDDLKGGDLKNSGWSFMGYGGVQQTLPHDWQISANIYGATKRIELQTVSNSMVFYSFSVNKSFLKKKLNLSVSTQNPFSEYKSFSNTTSGTGYNSWNNYRVNVQDFRFSISYRFGDLKASVKKAARTISNDDVKSGGSQNEGSSKGSVN